MCGLRPIYTTRPANVRTHTDTLTQTHTHIIKPYKFAQAHTHVTLAKLGPAPPARRVLWPPLGLALGDLAQVKGSPAPPTPYRLLGGTTELNHQTLATKPRE